MTTACALAISNTEACLSTGPGMWGGGEQEEVVVTEAVNSFDGERTGHCNLTT